MGVTFLAPAGTYTSPATLTTKEISANGTYNASDDNANGYSAVTVNVEGGGGSSDFTTAEVTVTNNEQATKPVSLPYIEEADTEQGKPAVCTAYYGVASNETKTFSVVLYKGSAVAFIPDATSLTVEVTGSAQVLGLFVFITGACTITLASKSA